MNGYLVRMFTSAIPQTDGSAATPARLDFLQRLESLAIIPAAYFDAMGRSIRCGG
jgi:hypothetical protein